MIVSMTKQHFISKQDFVNHTIFLIIFSNNQTKCQQTNKWVKQDEYCLIMKTAYRMIIIFQHSKAYKIMYNRFKGFFL